MAFSIFDLSDLCSLCGKIIKLSGAQAKYLT